MPLPLKLTETFRYSQPRIKLEGRDAPIADPMHVLFCILGQFITPWEINNTIYCITRRNVACQVAEQMATRLALVCGVDSDHLVKIPPKISISPLATTTECNDVAGGEPTVRAGGFQEQKKCDRI